MWRKRLGLIKSEPSNIQIGMLQRELDLLSCSLKQRLSELEIWHLGVLCVSMVFRVMRSEKISEKERGDGRVQSTECGPVKWWLSPEAVRDLGKRCFTDDLIEMALRENGRKETGDSLHRSLFQGFLLQSKAETWGRSGLGAKLSREGYVFKLSYSTVCLPSDRDNKEGGGRKEERKEGRKANRGGQGEQGEQEGVGRIEEGRKGMQGRRRGKN